MSGFRTVAGSKGPSNIPMTNSYIRDAYKIHVLLVDHELEVVFNTAKMLELCGYTVTRVDNASTAIQVLSRSKTRFDLVMANSNSPDNQGHRLLELAVTKHIPIVLMSFNDNVVHTMRAMKTGALLYLKKPVPMEMLKHLWQLVMSLERRPNTVRDHRRDLLSTPMMNNVKLHNSGLAMAAYNNKEKETLGVSSNDDSDDKDSYAVNNNGWEGQSKNKRNVIEWTDQLHARFIYAVQKLGPRKCFPKEILKLMNVPGLTRLQVASYLQRCRKKHSCLFEEQKSQSYLQPDTSTRKSPLWSYNPTGVRFGSMPKLENTGETTRYDEHDQAGLIPNFVVPNGGDGHNCGPPMVPCQFTEMNKIKNSALEGVGTPQHVPWNLNYNQPDDDFFDFSSEALWHNIFNPVQQANLNENKVIEDDEEVDRSILWRKAREDNSGHITNEETSKVAGKIDGLLEKKKKREFTASGSSDILTTALGTEEQYGRVRGVEGFVKRASVSKSLAENLKDQEEEARILKIENEKLKAELARIKSNIEDRNVERVASNKSSHTKEKEDDDLMIFDCGNSTNKGRKCYLVIKDSGNRVGCGTIVSEEKNNWMVSVDVVFDEQAELPVATKSGARLIGDVVGATVGWPKELLTFEATKKRKNLATPSAGDVDQEKFKKVELSLPMPCKYLYLYAVKMMSNATTIPVVFDKFMFGREDNTYLLREDLLEFLEMREIGSRQIVVYMSYLYKYLKEQNRHEYVSFVDPNKIPTCGIGSDGENISKHIAEQLKASCNDNLCVIPYNVGYHWILSIVNEKRDTVYLLDSMGNRNRHDDWKNIVCNGVRKYNASVGITRAPSFKQLKGNLKQHGSVECGYCVMLYMRSIARCKDPQLEFMFASNKKKLYFTQSDYDEVRSEWSEFVYPYIQSSS